MSESMSMSRVHMVTEGSLLTSTLPEIRDEPAPPLAFMAVIAASATGTDCVLASYADEVLCVGADA